jgi:fructose-1,6-bisphosphatase/inositol monophosphatase family enzyme
MSKLVNERIESIIRNAAEVALVFFFDAASSMNARLKADKSVVTDADHAVQAYIIGEIKKTFPLSNFIAEEEFQNTDISAHDFTWVIDPIDGTTAYANKLPNWAIAVALLQNGTPAASWIYFPVFKQMYSAPLGEAIAYLNGTSLRYISRESGYQVQSNDILCLNSKTFQFFSMTKFDGRVIGLGSTLSHIILVANGFAIAATSIRNKVWDILPAQPIASRCGIEIRSHDGILLNYEKIISGDLAEIQKLDLVVASHANVFHAIRSIFIPL